MFSIFNGLLVSFRCFPTFPSNFILYYTNSANQKTNFLLISNDVSQTRYQDTVSVFYLPKKFRKFQLGCKWNTTFGSFQLKFSGVNEISEKVVPFSRWKLPNGKLCSSYRFLGISHLYHQTSIPSHSFKQPGLPRLPPKYFVNGNALCLSYRAITLMLLLKCFISTFVNVFQSVKSHFDYSFNLFHSFHRTF